MTLPPRYFEAVERCVFPNGRSPARVAEVAARVKALWERFNARRADLRRTYMAEAAQLDAYVAAFLLPNAERVRAILTAHGRATLGRALTRAAAADAEVRVLDFGAGPLSATAGLIAACEALTPGLRFSITAVDLSAPAVEEGARLIHAGFPGRVAVETRTLIDQTPQAHFDVVLAANVLNEMPPTARGTVLDTLSARVARGGVLLVLEPGQDVHSRALSSTRDAFLARTTSAPFTLLAPCPHRRGCPLSEGSGRPDWCWFRHTWPLPSSLRLIDEATGLEHAELAFSFLLFVREDTSALVVGPEPSRARLTPRGPAERDGGPAAPHARVVSDFIRTPATADARGRLLAHVMRNAALPVSAQDVGRRISSSDGGKVLLCTSEGALEGCYLTARERARSGPGGNAWARGKTVSLTRDQVRAKEKAKAPRPPEPRGPVPRITRNGAGGRNR